MSARIRIKKTEILSDQWLKITRTTFDYQRADGTWQTHVREVEDHGDAAAILLLNPQRKTVILTRQFRLPAFLNGHEGWLIEAAAGLLDGDDPKICAAREAEEETGYRVRNMRFAMRAFMSPGSLTECVHLFIAEYDAKSRISAGGGLEEEGEDIEILELAFDNALDMVATGEIADAKTILLLQYARLNQLA